MGKWCDITVNNDLLAEDDKVADYIKLVEYEVDKQLDLAVLNFMFYGTTVIEDKDANDE